MVSVTFNKWVERLNDKHPTLTYELVGSFHTHKTSAIFTCTEHGTFESTIFNVYRAKHGCPECAKAFTVNSKRKPRNHFVNIINKANKLGQELMIPDELDSLSYIRVKCEKHGWFRISINSFKTGSGCTKCGADSSSLKQYGKPKSGHK